MKFPKNKKSVINIQTFIAAIGVVMVWRGTWGLLDKYLFPNNPDLSYFVSILVGILILIVDDFLLDELRTSH